MNQGRTAADAAPAASPPKDKWEWKRMILDSDLSPPQRLVLLTLEARMDVDGTKCWPSIETIQGDTGLSRSTVFDALRVLRERRWVTVHSGGGAGRSNHYSASVPDEKRSISRTVLGKKGPASGQNGPSPGPKETQKRPIESTALGVERPRRGATAVPDLDSPMLIAAAGEHHAGPDPLRDLILERRLDADEETLCGLAEKAVDSLRIEPDVPDAGTRLREVVDAVLAVDSGCELRMTAEQVSEVVEKFSREVAAHQTDELAAIAVAAEDRRPTRVGPHRVNFTLGRLRHIHRQMKAAA